MLSSSTKAATPRRALALAQQSSKGGAQETAHVRGVVQILPCQHFLGSQSKSTCQDELDKLSLRSQRLPSLDCTLVAMVFWSMLSI